MPGPPRKRQKTVHKVAELEKKINALTDALLAKQQSNEDKTRTEESTPRETTATTSEPARTEITSNTSLDSVYPRKYVETTKTPQPVFVTGCEAAFVNPGAKDCYVDVVDRGLLSMETATAMYVHWRDNMAPKAPLVSFSASADVQEIRKTRPMTFLSILNIASPVISPSQQPALTTEISRQFSDRVFFHGDKSVDLIQALLLSSQFYTRPHNARDMTFVGVRLQNMPQRSFSYHPGET
jgi:hypothetical protein